MTSRGGVPATDTRRLVDLGQHLNEVLQGEASGLLPLAAGRDVVLQPVVLDHVADQGGVRAFALRVPGADPGEVGEQGVRAVLAAVLVFAGLHQVIEVGDAVRRGGGRLRDAPLARTPGGEALPGRVTVDPGVAGAAPARALLG
ncbi:MULTISPECIES: hypothetical protein [Streptomyces]|uniref:Uncharacterized protein n=2 Tax=Streptomyces TaxID=1883 RepID=A0ABV9J668_9ACTN